MKIWIRDIIIDRDRGVVEVNVREVPALTIENLNEKGANKKGTHKVVSAQCSGDTNFRQCETLRDLRL